MGTQLSGSISELQEGEAALELLAAQRQLSTESKRIRGLRVLLLAVVGGTGLATVAAPELRGLATAAAGIAVLLGLIAHRIEGQRRRLAARVREEFDTLVLGLPWNRFLGRRADFEDVAAAARRYGVGRSELHGWYEAPVHVQGELAVLLCQRASLRWDSELRRRYAIGIGVALVVGAVVFIWIGAATGALLADAVWMVAPLTPILVHAADTAQAHWSHAESQRHLQDEVQELWETALSRGSGPRQATLRQVQDRLFSLRSEAPPVPDWFYEVHRSGQELEMRAASSRLADEARDRIRGREDGVRGASTQESLPTIRSAAADKSDPKEAATE